MTDITRLVADAARGRDTEEFVDTVGWDDVILPDLRAQREASVGSLVQALLDPTATSGQDRLSVACGLAGQIHGIDTIITTVRERIVKGRRAIERARDEGYIPKI